LALSVAAAKWQELVTKGIAERERQPKLNL
jgi:hypothetical protein